MIQDMSRCEYLGYAFMGLLWAGFFGFYCAIKQEMSASEPTAGPEILFFTMIGDYPGCQDLRYQVQFPCGDSSPTLSVSVSEANMWFKDIDMEVVQVKGTPFVYKDRQTFEVCSRYLATFPVSTPV